MSYADFLASKAQKNTGHGFEPAGLPGHLFNFQHEMTAWALRQGRAAIFADCERRSDLEPQLFGDDQDEAS